MKSDCLFRRVMAVGMVCALLMQALLPSAALAMPFPGTSPPPPASPSGGQGPSNNPSEQDPKVQSVVDPIDVFNGDFILARQDVFVPGRGLSVDLTFTYRSRSSYNGLFGYGWDLSYHHRLRKLDNDNVLVLRGSNRQDEFTFGAPNTYTAPAGVYDTLVVNADGTAVLTSKHGDKEFFDTEGNLTKMEDRNGNALTFAYDVAGLLPITGKSDYFVNQTTGVIARVYRLTRITDTIGRNVDFTYNSDGRVATITTEGRTITYGYDPSASGDLLSMTDPLGNVTRYGYISHNLTTITDPRGQIYLTNVYDAVTDRATSQTYGTGTSTIVYGKDTAGNSTSEVTDRRGFRTLFTFDSIGHITRQEEFTDGNPAGEPASFVTVYEYNAAGERTRTLFPLGNATEFTYDAKGNLLEIRRKKIGIAKGVADPTDIVTSFTYDATFSFVKTATDPRGNVTTYTYDGKGNLTQLKTPNLKLTNFTYNGFGQLEKVTDPNGNVTQYEYDSATGYLTKLTAGLGTANAAATAFTYDSVGNVTSVTDANGRTTTFAYDALNHPTKVTVPAPFLFETHYTYDANGNLIQVDRQAKDSAPGPRPPTGAFSATDDWQSTLYIYTALDQLSFITDDLGQITSFAYDANGNRRTITDAKNQTTTYTYDERNLLASVTDAAIPPGVATHAYDANGNLSSLKDANGNLTTYAYDDFDRLVRTTYSGGSFEAYTYNAASNLIKIQTPKGELIQFTYDSLNRLTKKTTPQEETTTTYDAGGRLTRISDADATLTYAYDSVDRVTQVTTVSPGLLATNVGYSYDANGNRTKLTYPDNSFVTYTYDALNRLELIKDAGGVTLADFSYDALSRRSGLAFPNSVNTAYQFDAVSRLKELQATDSASRTLVQASYTYDSLGNRTTLTDAAGTHAYTYDPLSQVTAVDYPAGSAFADTTFGLDAVGNRTQVAASSTTSYTANVLNQYTAVGSASLSYDANGNLIADGVNRYAYDAESHLTRVDLPATNSSSLRTASYPYRPPTRLTSASLRTASSSSPRTAGYTYDPFGRRITQTVDGVTTRFLYEGDQPIAETDGVGNITAKVIYGPGIDEPLKGLSPQGTVPEWYYHADGLGSVTVLTDSGGRVIERTSYDIYGQPKITDANGNARATSTVGNRFLFTGREWDSESGLYHYRARAYSPTLGRFLQRDPLGYLPDINLYRYVGNNPLTWIDPWGLDKKGKEGPKTPEQRLVQEVIKSVVVIAGFGVATVVTIGTPLFPWIVIGEAIYTIWEGYQLYKEAAPFFENRVWWLEQEAERQAGFGGRLFRASDTSELKNHRPP